jgi:hypothetical protein
LLENLYQEEQGVHLCIEPLPTASRDTLQSKSSRQQQSNRLGKTAAVIMTDTASAREEVLKCEQEIHSIKAALRRIGMSPLSPDADGEQNAMEIVLLKVRTFECML